MPERCSAKVNPEVRYLRRRRADGSTYTVRYEKGDDCPNEAIVSRREYGRTVHRCLDHLAPIDAVAA